MLNPLSPKPSRVLFIDEEYLKATTPLNENIDPKVLIPSIKTAQDKHILQICGSGIYEDMKQQIASGGTVTGSYVALLNDYIQPCLAWWTLVECLPTIVWRLQNKGMEKKNSEFSASPEKDDIIFMKDQYAETAKYYARLLINYLIRNQDQFPLYYNPGGPNGSDIDTIYGIKTEYFSGLQMPASALNQSGNNSIVGLGLGADVIFVPKGS